jgi:ATP-dependent DNA ligase
LVHAARRLTPNGLDAWAQVLERGYEGLVAKDEASPYVGGRTRAWLKVKVQAGRRASTGGGSRTMGRRDAPQNGSRASKC